MEIASVNFIMILEQNQLGTDHLIFHGGGGGGGGNPKKNIEHVSNGRKTNRTSLKADFQSSHEAPRSSLRVFASK
jgi:hypothetical protein